MPGPYWYIRLTTRAWKKLWHRLSPRKEYHVPGYILHVVPVTTHTLVKLKSIRRREEKKRKDKTKRGSKERKGGKNTILFFFFFFSFFFRTLLLSSFWTSRGHKCRPFSSPVLAFNFIAHRVRQSHCSSIFHRVLLTHALALSASQFVRKKKSPRIYTSMHSAGFELTKLTYTRLEDNLIRHPGDQLILADPRNWLKTALGS